jgi:hypothetical protein
MWTAAFSYLAWMLMFGVYRYAVTLEMLSPLLIATAVGLWSLGPRVGTGFLAVVLGALVITTVPADWGRLPAWTRHMVEVEAPPVSDPDRALVLMIGFEPASFLIPAFPPQIPFVRLQGYLMDPDQGENGLIALARRRVAAHRGEFYALLAGWEQSTAERVLPRYGLAADFTACRDVPNNLAPVTLKLCPVQRATARP